MAKTDTKAKEPIKIRFKELTNGNRSIYLDTIRNGRRSYEFLKMYLIPETSKDAKAQNKHTMEAAKVIQAERLRALYSGEAGIKADSSRAKIRLVDYAEGCRIRKVKNGLSRSSDLLMRRVVEHLAAYKGDAVTMREIDKRFCMGFIDYLRNAKRKDGRTLATGTSKLYFVAFTGILNDAVKDGVIQMNPATLLEKEERIKAEETEREYLTIDEVRRLIDTPCSHDSVKRAFLFSCFSGLRLSDVEGLTWGNLIKDGEQWRARIVMRKTRHELNLPLSSEAMRWVPQQGDSEKVFALPSSRAYLGLILKTWVKIAGIDKHISFHCARHTFATMMLTLGADLYTASNLLGHRDIKTTQIYAKIVDRKKDEAVNLVNGLFD